MSFPRYPEYKPSGVGWLGEVPALWQLRKIKHFTRFVGGGTPARDNAAFWNGDIPWVSPKDMKAEAIEGAEESITAAGLVGSTASLIEPGAVLMVVRSGILKHTIPVAINEVAVALNQDMKALRFSSVDPRFFLRWVQGLNDLLLLAWSKQGATVESVEHEYLAETLVPLPPEEEQAAIAAFLDRETGKIDALVAEQENLIELLKEKRQAVISHAVTKGLNPDVPTKASGIEWMGDVPAGWDIITLGRITTSKCDGPFGSGLKAEHYVDQGARVIRLQNIRGGVFDDGDAAFIDISYFKSEMSGHDVREGDVLIAGLGDDNNTVGRACVAPPAIYPAMVKADCFRFRLDRDVAHPPFIAWALTVGSAFDAGTLSSGSTRSRIPLSDMSARKVPLPPLMEQRAVCDHIDGLRHGFGGLIEESTRVIALLKERRSALISAAVTGQIDVRGLAA